MFIVPRPNPLPGVIVSEPARPAAANEPTDMLSVGLAVSVRLSAPTVVNCPVIRSAPASVPPALIVTARSMVPWPPSVALEFTVTAGAA